MSAYKKRSAFTMIELLFVIVVLGIVGGITLETIRQYYEGIYRTGEYSKRSDQADHILDQLTKYFENAISSSIVNLDQQGAAVGCYGPPVAGDANDYTIAFVGVDGDSMRGLSGRPGWSEETLLRSNNVLMALDVNYTNANTIINSLGSTLGNSAVYDMDSVDVNACSRFSWDGLGGNAAFHRMNNVVNPTSATTIELNADNNATNGKRKYLLRTGYAFKVQDDGNFTMYSNFRPWAGINYKNATNINLLGQNVAHFYVDYNASDFQNNPGVSDRGLVWRLKVCMRGLDANLSNSDIEAQGICRERRVHVRY